MPRPNVTVTAGQTEGSYSVSFATKLSTGTSLPASSRISSRLGLVRRRRNAQAREALGRPSFIAISP